MAAYAGGLSVGREGPFVHMASCIANKMSKLHWFSDIEKNQSLKKMMLAGAVAAGTTAAFGSPTGGVLFSIEVASTYYMVSNLWKAFFAATSAILMFRYLEVYSTIELFDKT